VVIAEIYQSNQYSSVVFITTIYLSIYQSIFIFIHHRYLKSAFGKWRTGKFEAIDSSDVNMFVSKAGIMLKQAEEGRIELQTMLREAITTTTMIKQKIDVAGLSRDLHKKLVKSDHFRGTTTTTTTTTTSITTSSTNTTTTTSSTTTSTNTNTTTTTTTATTTNTYDDDDEDCDDDNYYA